MKRFEDYEKAYNKCYELCLLYTSDARRQRQMCIRDSYELLQKLTALIKETDGNLTIEIRFTYIDKYPMLSVKYYCNYLYSFLPQEDGTFIISTDNKIYTMDEIEAKIRKNCYLD